jgi:multicomponent Na+:H+ antiporter subunit G
VTSPLTVVAYPLTGAGALVAVLAALAALRPRTVYPRLHYLTVVTSLAGPLVGLGVALVNGIGLTTATVALITVLQAVCGPILGAATGRLNAQRDGLTSRETPR